MSTCCSCRRLRHPSHPTDASRCTGLHWAVAHCRQQERRNQRFAAALAAVRQHPLAQDAQWTEDDHSRPRIAGSESGATRKALLRMLQPGGELAEAASVIVYCTYQAQCSELAGFLCTRGLVAAAYHAGKPMKASK